MKTTILLMATVFMVGCRETPKDPDRSIATDPRPTAAVRLADLPFTFEAGGVVRSRVTASIASRIMAPVTEVHVQAGDRVRQGAPLVTLDGREATAALDRADAGVIGSLEATKAAEGAVRAAEAAASLTRATEARIRTLHDKRSATPQELDQAVSAREAADAQVTSARANLAAAVSARAAAQAAHAGAVAATTYMRLTAPFDGVVSARHADPGAMASPGQPLLTVDGTALRLEVTVDEARAGLVAPTQPVDVQVGNEPTAAWHPARVGEVARIDPLAHSVVVKIDLPAADGLRSGAYGRARFSGPARRTQVVPESAVVRRGQLTFVFVVDEGRPRLQPVSLGESAGNDREVLSGVREGELVVSAPSASLLDGDVSGNRR